MGTHSQCKQASSSQITYMYNTFPFYSCVLCMLSGGRVEEERDLENHYIFFYFQLGLYLS